MLLLSILFINMMTKIIDAAKIRQKNDTTKYREIILGLQTTFLNRKFFNRLYMCIIRFSLHSILDYLRRFYRVNSASWVKTLIGAVANVFGKFENHAKEIGIDRAHFTYLKNCKRKKNIYRNLTIFATLK